MEITDERHGSPLSLLDRGGLVALCLAALVLFTVLLGRRYWLDLACEGVLLVLFRCSLGGAVAALLGARVQDLVEVLRTGATALPRRAPRGWCPGQDSNLRPTA